MFKFKKEKRSLVDMAKYQAGEIYFNRKFAKFESPPHTNCVRARQETRNFNLKFEFSE